MNISESEKKEQLSSGSQTETHHQENELRKEGVSSIPTKKYNQEED